MKKRLFRIWTAMVLALICISALACGAGENEIDELERTATLTYSGVSDEKILLMTEDGEVLRFTYSYSGFTHETKYPFPCYTSVGSVLKLADIREGQRMTIRYTGDDLSKIFAKKQYKKIRELRALELPAGATTQFGVVKEIGEDRLLVYFGRCDDIADIAPADCTYVPIRHVPILPDDLFADREQEIKIDVGTYVRVFHSGETAERTLADVYSVRVCMQVITKQFRVTRILNDAFWIHGDDDTMRLGHGIFDDGEVFENGKPVNADSIRIGDVLEVAWSGMVAQSYPGQFGSVYAVRVAKRTDEVEYLGVVKENLGDSLLVYFSGADRVDETDRVNDIAEISAVDCLRVPLTGVTVKAGTDYNAAMSASDIGPGDRVWVTYKGENFETAPSESCGVAKITWYKKCTVTLTVSELLENHVLMVDENGRRFSYHKTARHPFGLYENGVEIGFTALNVGDRVAVDHGGDEWSWTDQKKDPSYSFRDVFAMRVIERAKK